jgi:tetratricopeptide (TPR) repeat protein
VTARLLCTVLLASLPACRAAPPQQAPRVELQQRETPAPSPAPQGQLARVRPPAPRCLAGRAPAVPALVDRAAELFERGEHRGALACAEEALRAAPRSVPALHWRASALVALGRLDAARLAYARALAVDPEDAETLLGAADLYVARAKGEREGLLVGLEYALRGARIALAADDLDLRARLLHVAAMAENDLGRSRDALAHAEEALRQRPRDAALHYERGVALYELVRFRDARAALERSLALAPGDAWTLHYLALVAEHEGDRARADRLEAQARTRGPSGLRGVAIDRSEFEAEVERAIAALPPHERRALDAVPLEIADVPALADLVAVDPPLSPTILGLFRGPPEGDACEDEPPPCRSIVLYRRNLARFSRDRAELAEQVRVTLLHELGHLHGETDDELRDRGLE